MYAQSIFGRGRHWGGPDRCEGRRERHGRGGGLGQDAFGVRRPLRFLAHKLELSEAQVEGLARVLEELKLARAQAALDDRRVMSEYAAALEGDEFDAAKCAEATGARARGAESLNAAVAKALQRIHAILEPPQRARLATLIRTGHVAL